MIEMDEAQAMAERWRRSFGDELAFERSWRKYWDTTTVPDAARLEAWLQGDLDKHRTAAVGLGRAGQAAAVNAIGRPLEYVHAELEICPLCSTHFDGPYIDHIADKHKARPEPDSEVNNLRLDLKIAKQRYLDACTAKGVA